MKIVYFNNEKRLLRALEKVENPVFYGLHEIRWNNGGDAISEDTEFYLILEDDVEFESVTEEEFLRQFKEQAKFELAKILERNKLYYMAGGTLDEKQIEFISDKTKIENMTTIEEIKIFMNEIKTRTIGFGQ
jgi:hypothetical protein